MDERLVGIGGWGEAGEGEEGEHLRLNEFMGYSVRGLLL